MMHNLIVFVCLTFSFVKVSNSKQESTTLELFEVENKQQLEEVYRGAPASFNKFLEEKEIIKPINFRGALQADGVGVGTDKATVIFNFNKYLRESFENRFNIDKITEIRPEKLSMDITKKYQDKIIHRPEPGEKRVTVIEFAEKYEGKQGGAFKTISFAYVYMEIEETCEKNWIQKNQRTFDYFLNIEIRGISVNGQRFDILREKVDEIGVAGAIAYIKNEAKISWDDL